MIALHGERSTRIEIVCDTPGDGLERLPGRLGCGGVSRQSHHGAKQRRVFGGKNIEEKRLKTSIAYH